MQDIFHQKLTSIVNILKASPGSVSVKNIQRLSNIYKFEAFIEKVENQSFERLSIAGKILVIDIDFIETPGKNKDQKAKFELKDVKLILANNNNGFKYHNTETDENILKNCLMNYSNLSQFDKNLEILAILDQFSHDEFDLYDYYTKIYDSFKKNPGFEVKMNVDDKFSIIVQNKFEISLINDDVFNLSRIEYDGNEWIDKKQKINDLGIKVKILDDTPISITRNILLQNGVIFNDSQKTKFFDSEQIFKSKRQLNLTFQGFQFLESELLKIFEFSSDDLQSISKVIIELEKFDKLEKFINQVKENFTAVDKLEDLEKQEIRLNDFINEDNDEDEIEIDQHFITMSLIQQSIELKSDDTSLNFIIDCSNKDTLDEGLNKLKPLLEK